MKRGCVILSLALVGLSAAGASAVPIAYVSATTVTSTYDAVEKLFLLDDIRPLNVYYGDSYTVLPGIRFLLSTHLSEDQSDPETHIAYGVFTGGSVLLEDTAIPEAPENILLKGDIQTLFVTEAVDGAGILLAAGTFAIVEGSMMADWGLSEGSIFDLVFEVTPRTVDDFSVSFSGRSDVTLAPIPEPTTLALLGIGLAGMGLIRRKRS